MKNEMLFKGIIVILFGVILLREGWACFAEHRPEDLVKETVLFAFLRWFISVLTRRDYDDWAGQL
ncbi:hypothetical protein ACFQZI_14195 [Mucilaginibacter lutimaris]|uniref:Uncharacterized protein n=1 Tax=Mucilaginibacter lutimaris TaxID=931629 RepID=A0ABW2ZIF0_9SPHI